MAYKLTRETLVLDLYGAFILAKQHKTNKEYVKIYERRLKKNIERLADDLFFRRYKPEPSSCFIVERPKKERFLRHNFVTVLYITFILIILTKYLKELLYKIVIAVFQNEVRITV